MNNERYGIPFSEVKNLNIRWNRKDRGPNIRDDSEWEDDYDDDFDGFDDDGGYEQGSGFDDDFNGYDDERDW